MPDWLINLQDWWATVALPWLNTDNIRTAATALALPISVLAYLNSRSTRRLARQKFNYDLSLDDKKNKLHSVSVLPTFYPDSRVRCYELRVVNGPDDAVLTDLEATFIFTSGELSTDFPWRRAWRIEWSHRLRDDSPLNLSGPSLGEPIRLESSQLLCWRIPWIGPPLDKFEEVLILKAKTSRGDILQSQPDGHLWKKPASSAVTLSRTPHPKAGYYFDDGFPADSIVDFPTQFGRWLEQHQQINVGHDDTGGQITI